MPRYFFDVYDGGNLFGDSEGFSFGGVEAAAGYAAVVALEFVAEGLVLSPLNDCLIEICDEAGVVLQIVAFDPGAKSRSSAPQ